LIRKTTGEQSAALTDYVLYTSDDTVDDVVFIILSVHAPI